MPLEIISVKDFLLIPIYLIGTIWFTGFWAKKYYKGSSIRKYILPVWGLRILGCLLGVIYNHADTFIYYDAILKINHLFYQNPTEALHIFFAPLNHISAEELRHLSLNFDNVAFRYESNALIPRIGTLLYLFACKSYVCLNLIMAYFSFIGCWKLFLVFNYVYPQLEKKIAIATLFIPSVCFWGSIGLSKESILLGAFGLFLHDFYLLIYKKKKITFFLALSLVFNFFLLAIIKVFVVIILIPVIFVCFFVMHHKKFTSIYSKITVAALIGIVSFFSIYLVSKNNQKFNLNNIVKSAFVYREGNYKSTIVSGGSSYTLGQTEPTFTGLVKLIPVSVLTALFRPSIFDAKKNILIPAILENFLLFMFTIYSLIKLRRENFSTILSRILNPVTLFCLLFALAVLFVSGFTASNFGNLVRYRIIALPFFLIFLIVINYDKEKSIKGIV